MENYGTVFQKFSDLNLDSSVLGVDPGCFCSSPSRRVRFAPRRLTAGHGTGCAVISRLGTAAVISGAMGDSRWQVVFKGLGYPGG
ncbi:hypothetical protein DC28_05860 [Spirochaeta lutea]|uniref:Uncharacterized protein n=1 Tax=Spirochaeta lutea TaxID=1480694 RepID=A0A098QYM6_9SPIO|nr:hypothetical protein DC28_05860 [Spirochaeta lutea]